MKKIILIFMAFLVFLACFNSMLGYQGRNYTESVHAVVSIINKVGDFSTSTLSVFKPFFNTSDKIFDVEIPSSLQRTWQVMYVNEHLDCDDTCHAELSYYLYNMYYSDVKQYYLGIGRGDFNDRFERVVFGWYFPERKNSEPELVEEIYQYALSEGYPMDNPYLEDRVPKYEYTCKCCEVK